MKTNVFYHGDCLFVMKHDIPAESIDLIYLDPPFFGTGVQKGTVDWNPGVMQISYDDSKKFWSKQEIRDNAPLWMKGVAAKKPASHWNPLARYLFYMMERLEACKRVLKPTGSIYLHCDWRASHYLKMVMDEVFGYENFRNEIVWCYYGGGITKYFFKRKHDIIYFYSKSDNYKFNPVIKGEKGRFYKKGVEIKNPPVFEDWWIDIPARGTATHSKEWVGYPTQKPEALLERIIKASSNPGDVVLDPFCGCGTTIIVAHKLNRRWIGIDINEQALKVIKQRITKMGLNQANFNFEVEYPSFEINYETLKKMNGKEFEHWVNKMCNAKEPSYDGGIDGIMEDGTPIQTKTWKVSYDIVGRLLVDAEAHEEVPRPLKKIRVVSRESFDESAWKRADWIERNKGIKVELLTPKELLEAKE